MKVFICWSEERSKVVAEALHVWLKRVIQELKPFLSTQDIRTGKLWILEIASQLAETKFGILCLTRENLNSPWLNFEAGALSKTIDDKTFVCPYLISGLQSAEVPVPLGEFQSVPANKEGTLKLLKTINTALAEKKLDEDVLKDAFEKYWPDLERVLQNLPAVEGAEKPRRKVDDIVEEILDTVRGLAFMMQKREEIVPSVFSESLSELLEGRGMEYKLEDLPRLISRRSKVKGLIEEACKDLLKKEELKKKAEIP